MLLSRNGFSLPTVGLCLLTLVLGCSGRPTRVPVSGKVTIDGQPVPSGSIRVVPKGDRPSYGDIGADGSFVLTCFEKADGCVPGTHPVEVIAIESVPGGMKWHAPEKYASSTTSGVTVTIAEPTDNLEIKLSWAGGKPFIKTNPKE